MAETTQSPVGLNNLYFKAIKLYVSKTSLEHSYPETVAFISRRTCAMYFFFAIAFVHLKEENVLAGKGAISVSVE